MTDSADFRIRPIVPEDVAFVINGWLEGYWSDCPCSLVMPKTEWWRRWHVVIENILADERTKTLVACNPEKEEQLYGFVCAQPPDVLHWVYVKQPYRGTRVAAELMRAVHACGDTRLSHWSYGAQRMQGYAQGAELGSSFTYDPRIIKEYHP